ncbi:MAG: hypothetical protein KDD92_11155 [Caldilineaceae bacterium]|nr:hypothetical protein [Caldilineaceae bacterium]
MSIEILSFGIGTLLAVIGLVVAYIQWKQAKDVERLRREQLLATINRAKYLIIPNDVIEKIISSDSTESKETLRQWLWTLHKGASDNYVNAVYYYLTFEDQFTYSELDLIKKAGTITTKWEEHIWRSLIALRAENRKPGIEIPDFELDRPGSTVKLWTENNNSQPSISNEQQAETNSVDTE